MNEIIKRFGYSLEELRTRKRDRDMSTVRWICFYYLRSFGYTLMQIAAYFKRHHATVLYGINAVQTIKNDRIINEFKKKYKDVQII